jgi:hypothetical protein
MAADLHSVASMHVKQHVGLLRWTAVCRQLQAVTQQSRPACPGRDTQRLAGTHCVQPRQPVGVHSEQSTDSECCSGQAQLLRGSRQRSAAAWVAASANTRCWWCRSQNTWPHHWPQAIPEQKQALAIAGLRELQSKRMMQGGSRGRHVHVCTCDNQAEVPLAVLHAVGGLCSDECATVPHLMLT